MPPGTRRSGSRWKPSASSSGRPAAGRIASSGGPKRLPTPCRARATGGRSSPVGLICSMFRPSDDATVFPFLVPSNFFAVVSLRQAAEMLERDPFRSRNGRRLPGIGRRSGKGPGPHAVVTHARFGKHIRLRGRRLRQLLLHRRQQRAQPAGASLFRRGRSFPIRSTRTRGGC